MLPLTVGRDHGVLREIVFGAGALTIEDVLAVAQAGVAVRLADDPGFRRHIRQGSAFLDRLLDRDGVIYGVTTGYGDSCTVPVPRALVEELPLHLARFHGCGLGAHLSHAAARAVLATRLASLCRGYSGVRLELLERFVEFLNLDVAPLIPEEGSVGASGDLTPLSYVVALLVGEREASHRGATLPAAELHQRLGLQPLSLRPKEGLAVMNGTAVMTALACDAFARADYLSRLTTRLTALASLALAGNRHHFDERLFAVKPHRGTQQVAAWLRRDLAVGEAPQNSGRLQDRYSVRCAPHVIGVLQDSLPWMRSFIETELNSVNDNPVIDGEAECVLLGGHFYGGHIAFAMDGLKVCVANLADLMDRQLALLVDVKFNHGLPANLSGAGPARQAINHGFKAVQIGASAWTAEALKLTMPASVFSRSTECHNQDKVSMGTIAARDCLRVLQLSEQVAAAETLAVTQAIELRRRASGRHGEEMAGEPTAFLTSVRESFAFLEEDRPLEPELRRVLTLIQRRHWPLYD
jgi:histidine ammonia-lyase